MDLILYYKESDMKKILILILVLFILQTCCSNQDKRDLETKIPGKVIDVHSHIFNLTYLAKEIHEIINQLAEIDNKKKLLEIPSQPARIEILNILNYFTGIIKLLKNKSEDNYQAEIKAFENSAMPYETLITVPLMMDLRYILDDNIKEDPIKYATNDRGLLDNIEKLFNDAFYDTAIKNIKEFLEDIIQVESSPKDKNYQKSGFESHLNELIDLKIKYKDKIYPFLAVDPRNPNIQLLIEKNVVVHDKNSTDIKASNTRYFQGIKLYPPLGYLPSHPKLKPVYDYCQAFSIPITFHCSTGGAYNARKTIFVQGFVKKKSLVNEKNICVQKNRIENKCLNKDLQEIDPIKHWVELKHWVRFEKYEHLKQFFSDPDNWEYIIEQYKDTPLRLNFAHFGGAKQFKKYLKVMDNQNTPPLENWTYKIINLIHDYKKYPIQVYTDISFFANDISEINGEIEGISIDELKLFLGKNTGLQDRIMFGTDYIVLALDYKLLNDDKCNSGIKNYFNRFKALPADILYTNAWNFLGIPE